MHRPLSALTIFTAVGGWLLAVAAACGQGMAHDWPPHCILPFVDEAPFWSSSRSSDLPPHWNADSAVHSAPYADAYAARSLPRSETVASSTTENGSWSTHVTAALRLELATAALVHNFIQIEPDEDVKSNRANRLSHTDTETCPYLASHPKSAKLQSDSGEASGDATGISECPNYGYPMTYERHSEPVCPLEAEFGCDSWRDWTADEWDGQPVQPPLAPSNQSPAHHSNPVASDAQLPPIPTPSCEPDYEYLYDFERDDWYEPSYRYPEDMVPAEVSTPSSRAIGADHTPNDTRLSTSTEDRVPYADATLCPIYGPACFPTPACLSTRNECTPPLAEQKELAPAHHHQLVIESAREFLKQILPSFPSEDLSCLTYSWQDRWQRWLCESGAEHFARQVAEAWNASTTTTGELAVNEALMWEDCLVDVQPRPASWSRIDLPTSATQPVLKEVSRWAAVRVAWLLDDLGTAFHGASRQVLKMASADEPAQRR